MYATLQSSCMALPYRKQLKVNFARPVIHALLHTVDMLKFVSARGLLEILSSASEFDDQEIPVREKEERLLEQLHKHVRFSVPNVCVLKQKIRSCLTGSFC